MIGWRSRGRHSCTASPPARRCCSQAAEITGYVVRWDGGARKQFFPTLELAREFKGTVASGGRRLPLSRERVGAYYETWIHPLPGPHGARA